jgi:hypothetical protein
MWNSDLLEYVEYILIGICGIPTYWNMWNSGLLEYVDCLSTWWYLLPLVGNVNLLLTNEATLWQQCLNWKPNQIVI